jgi:hypothetical protein
VLLGAPELRLGGTLLLSAAGCLALATLARAVITAVAVRSGAATLRTVGAPELDAASAGLRGIGWAAAAAVVDLVLSVWFNGVLVSAAAAFLLGGPLVSLAGAAAVALALSLGLLLGPAAALWLELGLVVSVVQPARFGAAAGEALRLLLARPGFLVLSWLATALPAGALAGGVQVLSAAAPAPGWAAASAAGIALLLAGLGEALATLVRLDALAALVLDGRGLLPRPLPRPAAPPPVPRATLVGPEVPVAHPVGPMPPWTPGEPG